MTCLSVETIASPSGRRVYKRRVMHLQCDTCLKLLSRRWTLTYDEGTHYCNKRCSALATSATRMQKMKQTSMLRYGVEHHLSSERVKLKRHDTLSERYGDNATRYTNVSQIPRFKTFLNTKAACQKRHENMKLRGTFRTSKSEDRCYEQLVKLYGQQNVERQVVINSWPIDFFVKNIDVYVQFDGLYWHGLDRSLDEISQMKTARDVVILRKYFFDRRQDAWFKEQGLTLVRLFDANRKLK